MRSPLLFPILVALSTGTLAGSFLGACQPLPPAPRGLDVTVLPSEGLEDRQPNDVAIPPIELQDPGIKAPDLALRIAFQRALVQRHYAPLSLESVDRRVVDASYQPGNLREDAVLQVLVHRWDASHWDSSRDIFADVEVRLVDATRPDGEPLWAGRLEQKLRGYPYASRYTNQAALIQRLCDDYAADVLGALPARAASPQETEEP